MKITYTHFLSEEKAFERLKLLLNEVVKENNKLIHYLDEKIKNNVIEFNFFIKKLFIEGKSEIKSRDINIYIKIPFYLFFLKIKLKKIIRKKLSQILWYDKAKEYQLKNNLKKS